MNGNEEGADERDGCWDVARALAESAAVDNVG